MSHRSDLIATDIAAYLEQHRTKELLRFITCGSVDDGKSTLIGRLLHDSDLVYDDQLQAVADASKKHGTQGEEVDLALLVDGLRAEREQGITIDVAYRYFSTARRKFIIADCPGHEQYTRNMATGASTSELAVILVDARHGVMPQTRRHSFIVSLLGIRHVIVAINKMDLVDHSQAAFEKIQRQYHDFASKLDFGDVSYIPISALNGDNVVDASAHMPWYRGATLMHLLETVHIASDHNLKDLRLPVQLVMRPDHTFRGFAGTLASGVLRRGAAVAVMPSGKQSKVRSIETFDGALDEAVAPMAVTVTLEDEIDISRGDMLVDPERQPQATNELEATVVWMAEEPMVPGKEYLIKHTTQVVGGRVSDLRYGVDVNTMAQVALSTLALNQIGRCVIQTNRALYFDPYRRNRTTGAFILVDRLTNRTVGAGMIVERVAPRSYWEAEPAITEAARPSPVSREEHEARRGQRAVTLLLTGLTGAGKTTLANAVERRLFDAGRTAVVWDGIAMRRGIAKDLGYSDAHRSENVRRFAEMAGMLNGAGLVVIGALVAPRDKVRRKAARLVGEERFLTVYLECPVDVCRDRDQAIKGLYAKADAREIPDFVGVSSPYEPPAEADLVLPTHELTVDECVERILVLLGEHGVPTS